MSGVSVTRCVEPSVNHAQCSVAAMHGSSTKGAVMAKHPTHSPKIESLAGKTLANPNAGKVAKSLAGAVLAHGDGKPNKGGKK
jgi:hypothetical protein